MMQDAVTKTVQRISYLSVKLHAYTSLFISRETVWTHKGPELKSMMYLFLLGQSFVSIRVVIYIVRRTNALFNDVEDTLFWACLSAYPSSLLFLHSCPLSFDCVLCFLDPPADVYQLFLQTPSLSLSLYPFTNWAVSLPPLFLLSVSSLSTVSIGAPPSVLYRHLASCV